MARLTHVDGDGRARMVDVSDKPDTARTAVATGSIAMAPETLALALGGKAPKGAVEGVAELAGTMARQAHRRPHPFVPPAGAVGDRSARHADPRRQRADRHRDAFAPPDRRGSRWKR